MNNRLSVGILACLAFAGTSAMAEESKIEGSIGVEAPLYSRISNGGSASGVILDDFFMVGAAFQGSMPLQTDMRVFGEFTPVFRLKDTDLDLFAGFRLVPGVIYELKEGTYARGGLLVHYASSTFGSDTSMGIDPRIGIRRPMAREGRLWFIEAGLPMTVTGDIKELPEFVVRSGVEMKL